ncbi:MAG: hypothetical protein U0556_09915 [Dehalococcoidia bacterium]
MATPRHKQALASQAVRVSGVGVETAVTAAPCTLQRIVVANANAAVQTLTVTDGTTARQILRVPAGSTIAVEFRLAVVGSLKVTPSSADLDALVIYD